MGQPCSRSTFIISVSIFNAQQSPALPPPSQLVLPGAIRSSPGGFKSQVSVKKEPIWTGKIRERSSPHLKAFSFSWLSCQRMRGPEFQGKSSEHLCIGVWI